MQHERIESFQRKGSGAYYGDPLLKARCDSFMESLAPSQFLRECFFNVPNMRKLAKKREGTVPLLGCKAAHLAVFVSDTPAREMVGMVLKDDKSGSQLVTDILNHKLNYPPSFLAHAINAYDTATEKSKTVAHRKHVACSIIKAIQPGTDLLDVACNFGRALEKPAQPGADDYLILIGLLQQAAPKTPTPIAVQTPADLLHLIPA